MPKYNLHEIAKVGETAPEKKLNTSDKCLLRSPNTALDKLGKLATEQAPFQCSSSFLSVLHILHETFNRLAQVEKIR